MRLLSLALTASMMLRCISGAGAAEPASCRKVRLSDIGWTDVTATTATTAELLGRIGYQPEIRLLSLPVTYMSMKSDHVDAFLGDWEPSGGPVIKPFLARDGQPDGVERLGPNLVGAKYTLAVLHDTYMTGLKSFNDIARFGDALHHKIYGLEPGNDGDALVLSMLKENRFGTGHFILVESSEQGMLSQVAREQARKRPILFLAWEPHPMNLHFRLDYLADGDPVFGPNFGGATVNTIIRPGYAGQCPNLVRLLGRIRFTVSEEDQMMSAILDSHHTPGQVGRDWLAAHPDQVRSWLDGITTPDGRPALAAFDTTPKG